MASDRRRRAWPRVVAAYAFTAVAVVTAVFAIPRAMPGDPLDVYQLVDEDTGDARTPEEMAALRRHYGLDRPLPEQFRSYVGRVVRGELGTSITYNVEVATLLRRGLPWTLLLTGTALALSSMVAFVAGVAAAWRRGSAGDRLTTATLTTLNAVPDYALALVVAIVFGGVLGLFPLAGATGDTAGMGTAARVADVARHLVLPAGVLTCSLVGVKYLLVRNTMISVLGQDYMVLARAKGLPEHLLKYRHGARNALLPFLNVVGVQVGVALGSAVFVETIFAYPGVGNLVVSAVRKLDYPLIEGGFLLVAAMALAANLVVDLVSARLDPRTAR